jgi:hypothetical protein
MKNDVPVILVDAIQSIGVHNGIARIVLMRLGADGRPDEVLELCIPANQTTAIAQGIAKIK